MKKERQMTVEEVAEAWNCSKRCVRLLCKSGKIKTEKVRAKKEKVSKSPFKKWTITYTYIIDEKELRSIYKNCKRPTPPEPTEQIKEIGYEKPAHCRTLFTILKHYYRNNWHKAYLILFFCVLCTTGFFIDYSRISGYYPIYMLLANALLSTTIIIYCFMADYMDTSINRIAEAFSGSDKYKKYSKWFYCCAQFPPVRPSKIRSVLKDSSKNAETGEAAIQEEETSEEEDNREQGENDRYIVMPIVMWSLFCFLWFAIILYTVYVFCSQTNVISSTKDIRASGIILVCVYLVSMALVSQSYYGSILQMIFYHKISEHPNKEEIKKYPHNPEHPAQTGGLLLLLKNVKDYSTTFLATAFLFISTYVIIIHRHIIQGIDFPNNLHLLLLVVGVLVFDVLSTLIILIVPKIMMRRILNVWVEQSRTGYEEELRPLIDDKSECAEKKKELLYTKINQLAAEKIDIIDDNVQTILTIINIFTPLLTFIVAILTGQ